MLSVFLYVIVCICALIRLLFNLYPILSFSLTPLPHTSHLSPIFSTPLQTFHTPSLGDEEFEIPPITPPPETEPGMGLSEGDTPFPNLPEPPPPQRGNFTPQFPPQSLELPSITISRNLMNQDGGPLPVVSPQHNTNRPDTSARAKAKQMQTHIQTHS